MRVAIIDSGIVPEHPMFDGTNFEPPAERPDDDYCATVDASFCNGKLIVARHYTPPDIDESEVDTHTTLTDTAFTLPAPLLVTVSPTLKELSFQVLRRALI